ncbi:MAG: phage tail tip lysozyme, partial [Actinomycetia bacterium]|nr:phage tail tip lysozyme [Actinomycetes bacterium]
MLTPITRRTLLTATGISVAGICLGTAFAADAAENNNEIGFQYFRKAGLSAVHAAAIIGNFIQESHKGDGVMHPDRRQEGGGPGRGIAQWTVNQRWATLVSFARNQGRDPWSLSLQLDFVWHELHGTHRGAYQALVATGDIRSATLAFSKHYEGCGICHNDRRVAYAQRVYARYGSGGGGGGGGDTDLPVLSQ